MGKPHPLAGLKRLADPFPLFAQATELLQKDRLPDAAQASQNHALGGTAEPETLDRDTDDLKLSITTYECGRRTAGTWVYS